VGKLGGLEKSRGGAKPTKNYWSTERFTVTTNAQNTLQPGGALVLSPLAPPAGARDHRTKAKIRLAHLSNSLALVLNLNR